MRHLGRILQTTVQMHQSTVPRQSLSTFVTVRPSSCRQSVCLTSVVNCSAFTQDNRNQSQERYSEELLKLFPGCSATISKVIKNSPEIMSASPDLVHKYSKIFKSHGNKRLLTSEETLILFGTYPDLLFQSCEDLEKELVLLLGRCGQMKLPWSVIILENPDLVFTDGGSIINMASKLSQHFMGKELFLLVLNNPTIFKKSWTEVEEVLNYLVYTMRVSMGKVASTNGSLTQSLEFYTLRYTFLQRSGIYVHPSLNQIGAKLAEAEPSLDKIVGTDDLDFIKNCAPTLTLEEFNTFKALIYTEKMEYKELLQVDEEEEMEDFYSQENAQFQNTFRTKARKRNKNK